MTDLCFWIDEMIEKGGGKMGAQVRIKGVLEPMSGVLRAGPRKGLYILDTFALQGDPQQPQRAVHVPIQPVFAGEDIVFVIPAPPEATEQKIETDHAGIVIPN
jgi:hypothetical protein